MRLHQGVDYGMSKRLEMLFPYVYGKPGNVFPYGIDMAYSRRAGAGTTMHSYGASDNRNASPRVGDFELAGALSVTHRLCVYI